MKKIIFTVFMALICLPAFAYVVTDTRLEPYSNISGGQRQVANASTPIVLVATPTASKRVTVIGSQDNAGVVVIGGSNARATPEGNQRAGLRVLASKDTVLFINDLNKLYIDSTVSGDSVNYVYEY